jgi:hypothetical protein
MIRRTLVSVFAILILGCSDDAPVSTDFERLELRATGGFGPPPCDLGGSSYVLTRKSNELNWGFCDYQVSPAASVTGSRLLSAAELESVRNALSAVTRTSTAHCGADAGVVTLDVTTPEGVELYADDFYSGCPWEVHRGRTFVSGLSELTEVLQNLRSK